MLADAKLKVTQQCMQRPQKSNHILGCIQGSMASRASKVILSLCSALIKPHLECYIHLWAPHHSKDMSLLE